MAFGGDFEDDSESMSDINMTPLVDVMLVLLVIFIITAPLFTHAVKLDLPSAQSTAAPEKNGAPPPSPSSATPPVRPAGESPQR